MAVVANAGPIIALARLGTGTFQRDAAGDEPGGKAGGEGEGGVGGGETVKRKIQHKSLRRYRWLLTS